MAGKHGFSAHRAALLAGGCLTAALLLGGCAAAPQNSAPGSSEPTSQAASSAAAAPQSESAPAASVPAEAEALQITFTREEDPDQPRERGVIVAADAAGAEVWRHETEWLDSTELERVQEIGQNGGTYYFNDSGTVYALDAQTGAVLWTNADFGGASLAASFRENGDLLLCGFYGPDVCWLDSAGNTICRVEALDDDRYWPIAIWEENGEFCVTKEGTPDGTPYTYHLDPQALRAGQAG